MYIRTALFTSVPAKSPPWSKEGIRDAGRESEEVVVVAQAQVSPDATASDQPHHRGTCTSARQSFEPRPGRSKEKLREFERRPAYLPELVSEFGMGKKHFTWALEMLRLAILLLPLLPLAAGRRIAPDEEYLEELKHLTALWLDILATRCGMAVWASPRIYSRTAPSGRYPTAVSRCGRGSRWRASGGTGRSPSSRWSAPSPFRSSPWPGAVRAGSLSSSPSG